MAEKKKGIGNALLGLFVVREGEEGQGDAAADPSPDGAVEMVAEAGPSRDAVADDLIARYAGGGASGGHAQTGASPGGGRRPTRPPPPPQPATGGAAAPAQVEAPAQVPEVAVDFPQVLRSAGLTTEDQSRVEKALTLLHNLPAETPIEIKRQIVAASLQAFGIPVDQILEAALLHVAAYERHVRAGESETQSLLEQSNRRLAELEQEALRVRKIMNETKAHQQGLTFACSRQKVRIQEVLDFFGPDAVERARQSSVKLRNRQD